MESLKSKSVRERLLDIVFGEKPAPKNARTLIAQNPWLGGIGILLAAAWALLILACIANSFVTLPLVGDWLGENGRMSMSWIAICVGVVGYLISLRLKSRKGKQ